MKRVFKVRRVVNGGLVKADAFAGQLAEITKQVSKINTPSEAAQRRRVELVGPAVAALLGMTDKQVEAHARSLDVAGMMDLLLSLSTTLRTLNQAQADGSDQLNGPRAIHDYTAGESHDVVGLSKLGNPGAASIVDVQAVSNEIAHVLGIIVDEHNRRAREAPVNDGQILQPDQPGRVDPFLKAASRGRGMSLDQLDAYATAEARKASQLRRESDVAGALGVSQTSREAEQRVAKARGQRLPNDSYTGSQEPLAARIRRP